MRYVTAFCLFVLLSGRQTHGQVLPWSSGGCTISASGLTDCDWPSTIEFQRTGTKRTVAHAEVTDRSERELFLTLFRLLPGTPLDSRSIVGGEVLIVDRKNGEVINEKKSPSNHIAVYDGLVMLMPKGEPYLVRNIGKNYVDLLVIEVRERTPKPPLPMIPSASY